PRPARLPDGGHGRLPGGRAHQAASRACGHHHHDALVGGPARRRRALPPARAGRLPPQAHPQVAALRGDLYGHGHGRRGEGVRGARHTPLPAREGSPSHRSTPLMPPRYRRTALTPVRNTVVPPLVRLNVLLAEDNPVNRTLMIALLSKRGYNVTIAENGREAIDAHEREPFDVVLMDIQMPEMDGIQATTVIRQREGKSGIRVPIVALTAHAMRGDRERCLAAGMDDYLTKPIRSATLFETLERVARPASRKNGEPNGNVAPDAAPVSPCAPRDDPLLDSSRAFDPAHVLALVADDRDLLGKLV